MPRTNDEIVPPPQQPVHRGPRVWFHPPKEIADATPSNIVAAAGLIKSEDFSNLPGYVCFREGMLPGIASGTGIGALRFVMGGSIFAACNWASGGFILISIIAYNRCQHIRAQGADAARQAIAALKARDERLAKEKDDAQAVEAAQRPAGNPQNGVNFWSTFKFW